MNYHTGEPIHVVTHRYGKTHCVVMIPISPTMAYVLPTNGTAIAPIQQVTLNIEFAVKEGRVHKPQDCSNPLVST